MAVTPNSLVTPQTVVVGKAKLTTSNSGGYDAPTNTQVVLAGQANGARLTRVTATAGATLVAGDVELYGYDGTSYRHIKTLALSAQTINAGTNTAAITPYDFGFSDSAPLLLGPSEQLVAAVSVAQTSLHVRAEGGAY